MKLPPITEGPWFGPNYNSSTAEPTRALTGKFRPRGTKAPNDYLLRVEVSGDNVTANAKAIAAVPAMLEALNEILPLVRRALRNGIDDSSTPGSITAALGNSYERGIAALRLAGGIE